LIDRPDQNDRAALIDRPNQNYRAALIGRPNQNDRAALMDRPNQNYRAALIDRSEGQWLVKEARESTTVFSTVRHEGNIFIKNYYQV